MVWLGGAADALAAAETLPRSKFPKNKTQNYIDSTIASFVSPASRWAVEDSRLNGGVFPVPLLVWDGRKKVTSVSSLHLYKVRDGLIPGEKYSLWFNGTPGDPSQAALLLPKVTENELPHGEHVKIVARLLAHILITTVPPEGTDPIDHGITQLNRNIYQNWIQKNGESLWQWWRLSWFCCCELWSFALHILKFLAQFLFEHFLY